MIDNNQYRAHYERRKTGSSHNTPGNTQHKEISHIIIPYFSQIPSRRQAGERLAPFHVERLDYRNQDRIQFYKGLERNGPKAVEEFRKAFPTG